MRCVEAFLVCLAFLLVCMIVGCAHAPEKASPWGALSPDRGWVV